MGYADDSQALDAKLNDLKNNTTRLVLCAGEPANFSEAQTNFGVGSGKRLGEVTVSAADFTGPSAGDVDGRKLVSNAQGSVPISIDGTADHVAWVDTVNSRLKHVRPLAAPIAVSAGQVGTIEAQTITDRQSAAPA